VQIIDLSSEEEDESEEMGGDLKDLEEAKNDSFKSTCYGTMSSKGSSTDDSSRSHFLIKYYYYRNIESFY
jgi:hypothetical protein